MHWRYANGIVELAILRKNSERKLVRTIHCQSKNHHFVKAPCSSTSFYSYIFFLKKPTSNRTRCNKKNIGSGVTQTWFQILTPLLNTGYVSSQPRISMCRKRDDKIHAEGLLSGFMEIMDVKGWHMRPAAPGTQ